MNAKLTEALDAARAIVERERLAQARTSLCSAADDLDLENFAHRRALEDLAKADEELQQLAHLVTRASTAIQRAERWIVDPQTMSALYARPRKLWEGQDDNEGGEPWPA